MKKITLFTFAVAALSLASCKKDRTCTCTTTSSGGTTVNKTTYYKVKKSEFREKCIGSQTETTVSGGGASLTTTGDKKECELK
jgi:hypothetical protein